MLLRDILAGAFRANGGSPGKSIGKPLRKPFLHRLLRLKSCGSIELGLKEQGT